MDTTFTFKKVKKTIESNVYRIGIKRNKDSRKKVTHAKGSLRTGARGAYSSTTSKRSKISNSDVCVSLKKEYKFDILRDPFNPRKYPQAEWNRIKKNLLTQDPSKQKRLGNGLVAMVKNYMDKQTKRKNKESTAKAKHFNKFSIDSRQLQQSIGWNIKKVKTSN